MQKRLKIGKLRSVEVLYRGDLYELACVVLKANDALHDGTSSTGHPTVNGLARSYARLMNLDFEPLVRAVERQGLPLGACIVSDDIDPDSLGRVGVDA